MKSIILLVASVLLVGCDSSIHGAWEGDGVSGETNYLSASQPDDGGFADMSVLVDGDRAKISYDFDTQEIDGDLYDLDMTCQTVGLWNGTIYSSENAPACDPLDFEFTCDVDGERMDCFGDQAFSGQKFEFSLTDTF